MEKSPEILDVLDRLSRRLGTGAFVVCDHWERDLCAVGIASPPSEQVLVYISTYGEKASRYSYELELPSSTDTDSPYDDAGRGSDVSSEELAAVVAEHLARAKSPNQAVNPSGGSGGF